MRVHIADYADIPVLEGPAGLTLPHIKGFSLCQDRLHRPIKSNKGSAVGERQCTCDAHPHCR